MKKFMLTALVAISALTLLAEPTFVVRGKFNDAGKGVTQSFDKDAFEGEQSLKVVWSPGSGSAGILPPLVTDWTSFSTLVLETHNPGNSMIAMNMVVRVGGKRSSDTNFAIRKGTRTVKVPLSDVVDGNGDAMELNAVRHVYFYPAGSPTEDVVVYFKSITLE